MRPVRTEVTTELLLRRGTLPAPEAIALTSIKLAANV
jgi:hypothetical protein